MTRQPAIPAELAAAPRWVARRFSTGSTMARSKHVTFSLQRVKTAALLTTEIQIASAMGPVGQFRPWKKEEYLGTAKEEEGG